MHHLRGHWQLFALTAAIFLLWPTVFTLPLKILIVFFHEASHALAIVLTGGSVVSLSVSPDQGGLVIGRGGSRFLILSAGYLGSLLIGVTLLLTALRSRADRLVMAFCGAVMLLMAALYVRDIFALIFTICTGVGMLIMARMLGRRVNDLALRIIGLTSMIYVPYDIFSDTIVRSGAPSDARMLAMEFGGTTVMWGIIWLGISLYIIGWGITRALGHNSNLTLR